jgi:hypothetical protein
MRYASSNTTNRYVRHKEHVITHHNDIYNIREISQITNKINAVYLGFR